MVTAALVAGVGVAGVSAATAGAAPSDPDATALKALSHTGQAAGHAVAQPATDEQVTLSGYPAYQQATEHLRLDQQAALLQPAERWTRRQHSASGHAGIDQERGAQPAGIRGVVPPIADAGVSAAPVRQKPRPEPVVTVPAVNWVNPMPEASVTSCYGQRWGRLHAGVDLAAAHGTPIRAVGAGIVVRAGAQAGYGNAVLIDHGNGYLTHYGHLSTITVQVGQRLAVGAQIGQEGSTGHSTGPHLHFEVHEGTYKNPIEPTAWLHEHGVDIRGCANLTDR